jgi:hypothetical protein
MKVAEWVEALRALPQDKELATLVQVVCAHCRFVAVAIGWDEGGDPLVPGWRRQVGDSETCVCSAECADAAGAAVVLAGGRRPRWRMTFGGEA